MRPDRDRARAEDEVGHIRQRLETAPITSSANRPRCEPCRPRSGSLANLGIGQRTSVGVFPSVVKKRAHATVAGHGGQRQVGAPAAEHFAATVVSAAPMGGVQRVLPAIYAGGQGRLCNRARMRERSGTWVLLRSPDLETGVNGAASCSSRTEREVSRRTALTCTGCSPCRPPGTRRPGRATSNTEDANELLMERGSRIVRRAPDDDRRFGRGGTPQSRPKVRPSVGTPMSTGQRGRVFKKGQ